ncbi:MAG: Hcp family type VI secretion system effector [Steroidobacteraceae bacterium]
MAVDMFLDLDGVKGESKDKAHEGKIDLLAWSWGVANNGSFHTGGGGGTGKASFQDINMTKYVDAATPTLMLYCSNGKHFLKGKIIVRKAGDKPLEYLIIDIQDVLVSAYSTGGSGGEDRLTENISLNFAKVKVAYWTQGKDGGKGDPFNYGWDIAGNQKL